MFEFGTKEFLYGSKNPIDFFKTKAYKRKFKKEHSDYFEPDGILVFCGWQGSGKTISAVNYISQLTYIYPKAIVVTNTDLTNLNPATSVIEYNGMESLTDINNMFTLFSLLSNLNKYLNWNILRF